MHNKKAVPSIQLTISNSKKLENFLQAYYGKAWIRMAMNFIYIINEILLALYLLFIPIQIAYYWLLSNGEVDSLIFRMLKFRRALISQC